MPLSDRRCSSIRFIRIQPLPLARSAPTEDNATSLGTRAATAARATVWAIRSASSNRSARPYCCGLTT